MAKPVNKTTVDDATKRIARSRREGMISNIRTHPELSQLAINPLSKDYLSMRELNRKMPENKNIDEKLFEKIEYMDTYSDVGGGELLLNYDLQYRKQIDEIDKLKQMNGDMMDDKDIKLLQNDLEKSFSVGMAEVINKVEAKISGLEKKIEVIDKQAKQTCKDGNCTIDAIKELKEDIGNISTINNDKMNELEENMAKLNNDNATENNETIKQMNEKIETMCTGVDCLTKTFEDKENTVTCPICGGKFVWNNQTHCPLCDVTLEPIP